MPEPLATTKRKFHKLLDSLTRNANASVTPLPPQNDHEKSARDRLLAASERVSKRRRIEDQLITPTHSLSAQSSVSSLKQSTTTTSQSRSNGAVLSASRPLPAFSPWSQDSFLQRLRTFSSVALWHLKPDAINEVVWAKRGWQCVGVNTVACIGGCERRVIVDLSRQSTRSKRSEADEEGVVDENEGQPWTDVNDGEVDSLTKALTERYATEVVEGHGDKCLWRRGGCKDDIYRLQVVRPAVWRPQLQQRFTSLLQLSSSIKAVRLSSAVDDVFNTELLKHLVDMHSQEEIDASHDEHVRLKATRIALHGWRGTSDSNADLLQCDSCFQRVGLWMYQPGYHRRAKSQDEAQEGHDDDEALDLLTMHREYCPWRSSTSQCASGSLSGLNASEILARVVSTYIREQRRNLNTTHDEGTSLEAATEHEDIPPLKLSHEEEDKLDREREGRLQKLKRLLTLKRPRKVVAPV